VTKLIFANYWHTCSRKTLKKEMENKMKKNLILSFLMMALISITLGAKVAEAKNLTSAEISFNNPLVPANLTYYLPNDDCLNHISTLHCMGVFTNPVYQETFALLQNYFTHDQLEATRLGDYMIESYSSSFNTRAPCASTNKLVQRSFYVDSRDDFQIEMSEILSSLQSSNSKVNHLIKDEVELADLGRTLGADILNSDICNVAVPSKSVSDYYNDPQNLTKYMAVAQDEIKTFGIPLAFISPRNFTYLYNYELLKHATSGSK
jgi:hypothetical protein